MATPAELIRSLIDQHGMREHQIVTELEKLGVGVTQATDAGTTARYLDLLPDPPGLKRSLRPALKACFPLRYG